MNIRKTPARGKDKSMGVIKMSSSTISRGIIEQEDFSYGFQKINTVLRINTVISDFSELFPKTF